jgi:hypothetical protein
MLHIEVHLEHAWNQSKGHSGSRCDHQGIVLVQERPLAKLGIFGSSRRVDTNSSFSSFNPDRNIAATFQALPGATCVNGAAQAHDSALTTTSVEMKWLNSWSAAATFEGEFWCSRQGNLQGVRPVLDRSQIR